MPLGIYLFLLVSYTFKGALGSARYYESLTPFVCISAAYGASVIGERWRSALPPRVRGGAGARRVAARADRPVDVSRVRPPGVWGDLSGPPIVTAPIVTGGVWGDLSGPPIVTAAPS